MHDFDRVAADLFVRVERNGLICFPADRHSAQACAVDHVGRQQHGLILRAFGPRHIVAAAAHGGQQRTGGCADRESVQPFRIGEPDLFRVAVQGQHVVAALGQRDGSARLAGKMVLHRFSALLGEKFPVHVAVGFALFEVRQTGGVGVLGLFAAAAPFGDVVQEFQHCVPAGYAGVVFDQSDQTAPIASQEREREQRVGYPPSRDRCSRSAFARFSERRLLSRTEPSGEAPPVTSMRRRRPVGPA